MCTLLGRTAQGRRWILASTSDDPYAVQNQLVCAQARPYSYLAVRVVTARQDSDVPWNGMLTRGVNAAGLAYTYAYVHQPDVTWPPQRWAHDVLSGCRSVQGAVKVIKDHLGEVLSGNYLLADREGDAAALEVARADIAMTPAVDSTLVCTNFWAQLPMLERDRWGAETAAERYRRGKMLLSAGDGDLSTLFQAMRDHSDDGADAERPYGISICNHGQADGTISSEVIEPRAARLWWTYGWPCGAARGYEKLARVAWGRYVAFDVAKVTADGEVTRLDGQITPLGVRLIGAVEGA